MSAKMQVPLSQVRHSNVAVVRYTKNGVRLEIACYKNKVLSYRSGLENRMDEVLQIDRVFTNVGRGSYASAADILKALGPGHGEASALKFILDHGDLQVAQGERTSEVDEVLKDIITIISQKCVHTATKRPFPTHVIEQALKTMGAAVKPDHPAKKQALHLITKLIEANILPIQRANMKLRVTFSGDEAGRELEKVQMWFTENGGEIVRETSLTTSGVVVGGDGNAAPTAAPSSFAVLLPPHLFRDAETFAKSVPGCSLNVVETSVAETGEGAASDLQQQLLQSALPSSSSTAAKQQPSAAKQQQQQARKVATHDDGSSEASSSKDAHAVESNKKGNKKQTATKGAAVIAPVVSDDDDDDDDKRKKSKKKAKKAQPPAQPIPKQPTAKKPTDEDGSDEDLVSERKKKKPVAAVAATNFDDEEDFDYGEEDE